VVDIIEVVSDCTLRAINVALRQLEQHVEVAERFSPIVKSPGAGRYPIRKRSLLGSPDLMDIPERMLTATLEPVAVSTSDISGAINDRPSSEVQLTCDRDVVRGFE
jgi:hypothetical protein